MRTGNANQEGAFGCRLAMLSLSSALIMRTPKVNITLEVIKGQSLTYPRLASNSLYSFVLLIFLPPHP